MSIIGRIYTASIYSQGSPLFFWGFPRNWRIPVPINKVINKRNTPLKLNENRKIVLCQSSNWKGLTRLNNNQRSVVFFYPRLKHQILVQILTICSYYYHSNSVYCIRKIVLPQSPRLKEPRLKINIQIPCFL